MSQSSKPARAGRSRPTMRHVATLAGVGIKTVSRVMNGEPNVSSATIARVMEAAQSLDYQLDERAGNLRRADGRTRTLGLLVSSVDNPFSGTLHRAVEDAAQARGIAVFASSLDDDSQREKVAVNAFLRRRVDGLILTTISEDQSYLAPEMRHGTPMVFVDREPVGISGDTVISDNRGGAMTATEHLLNHGHHRIAYLGDRREIYTARERRGGFFDALGRAGIPTGGIPVIEDLHNEESATKAMLALLDSATPPTAVFTSQNLVTIGAIRALRSRGAHHTTALVGFDDFQLSDLLEPGVTVVAQDPQEIGRAAAERIIDRLDGDNCPARRCIVPTTLIARGTGEILPLIN
ncbi:LacI family DNA-binding transcriptional regulator [Arthrobacter sp. EH-1B-1]|uniref:LacI family DNA-binding transcriptional regulator n=1 Tax=Arthrobacter vasquezii TaxID=2977629 RepID=A0ABT6CUH9_9MICC|nr:LacI family DNA-binding transcriptional regulator [Arthrobacter vasquezii]MDF9277720.1 LacI family DNA-binding transcriptional regulator [Arthrobacter vasquezii]